MLSRRAFGRGAAAWCLAATLGGHAAGAQPPTAPPPTSFPPAADFPRSPRNASYTIDARLDPNAKTITATETIAWRNITSRPTAELQFHLYWNAWTDDRSTWMREQSLGRSRRLTGRRSNLAITSMIVTSGGMANPIAGQGFIAPDDDNANDRTVLAVSLSRPIAPGERATIAIGWTATIPTPVARTGVIGRYYFIAQWFPKLGVLEEGGWNTHQFHAGTEFFSDYGVYDVRLTVPVGWLVGATGREQERRDNGDGTATHRYVQEDVHDFAWTTSPDYLERTSRFVAQNLPPVDMRMLVQPEHLSQVDRHFAAASAALKRYGEWFGPYPYGHLTIVDPAYQSEADGMEYPTLVTAGTRWLVGPDVTIQTPEEVVVHEVGHQFWYGLVGSNEFEHAWMDEGINTFAAGRVLGEDFPNTYLERRFFGGFVPWVFRDIPLQRDTYWNRLAGYRPAARSDVPSTPSFRLYPTTGSAITYNKTALWLNTMERWLGWPTVQRVLSTFFARYQFAHPTPEQFFQTAEETSGRSLTGFFDQVYRSANVFDYGITDLRSERTTDGFRTTVVARRYGEAVFPVDVVVTFEDGHTATERWDGEDRWQMFAYTQPAQAVSAQVDPGRTLLLDVNYTNNSRTLRPRTEEAATKWSLKWMIWLQDALLSWGFLV